MSSAMFYLIVLLVIKQTNSQNNGRSADVCTGGFLYDSFKKSCRELHCFAPMQLINGSCDPGVRNLSSFQYDMFLRFDKIGDFYTYQWCYDTAGVSLFVYITQTINNLPIQAEICFINILRKVHSYFFFHFIMVHVKLSVDDVNQNISDVINVLIRAFTASESLYRRPNDCLNLKPKMLDGNFYDKDVESRHPLYQLYIDPADKRPFRLDPSMDFLKSQSMNNTTCHMVNADQSIHVSELNMCPLVTVSEFNVTREGDTLCVNDIDLCLERGRYRVQNTNGTEEIHICANVYFSHISKPYKEKEIGQDEVEMSVGISLSGISVVCLFVTVLTYSLFESLRTLPGLNNMALSACLLFAHTLYNLVPESISSWSVCGVIILLGHFAWFSSVLMMNVCSINMYKTFSRTSQRQPRNERKKRVTFLIGLSYCFITSSVLTVADFLYIYYEEQEHFMSDQYKCPITRQLYGLFTFLLPSVIILTSNVVLFIVTIVKIQKVSKDLRNLNSHRQNTVIYAKLSTITGITWLIAIVEELLSVAVLHYVLVVLNTAQGVFIMISFICNKRVLSLYQGLFRKCMKCDNKQTMDREANNASRCAHDPASQSENNETKTTKL